MYPKMIQISPLTWEHGLTKHFEEDIILSRL
jgi:hypothetical protein